MFIKIAALGALGYAGYRYFTSREGARSGDGSVRGGADRGLDASAASIGGSSGGARLNPVAGGPLTDAARVQHSPDAPVLPGERPHL